MLAKILTVLASTVTGAVLLMCCEYGVIFARLKLFGQEISVPSPGMYVMGKYGQQGGHMPDIGVMLNVDFLFNCALILLLIFGLKRRSKKRKAVA
jgi:hypothetical protein